MHVSLLKNSILWVFMAVFTGTAVGAELKHGRYVGSIEIDDTHEKVALVADIFAVQPEDSALLPVVNATFKMSLGGYGTSEYVTETFEVIHYDVDGGQLVLDEQTNDLVITANVSSHDGGTKITGRVWIRSAAKWGVLNLEHEGETPTGPFMPLLRGQYEGLCESQRAMIQITTGKGIGEETASQRGLSGYAIVAKLALDQPDVCGDGVPQDRPVWCVSRVFSSGTYNFFANHLVLDAASGSTSCSLVRGEMQCRIRMGDSPMMCKFNRKDLSFRPYEVFRRLYAVPASSDQRALLPEPSPPRYADLLEALNGEFVGYLHNETNDRYQPFKLVVNSTISTSDPRDSSHISISPTAVTYFGRALSGEYWPHQLQRQSFQLHPGLTLQSPHSDGFLQIEEWRKGYVEGVWFSHAYGRVGTVQLVKGSVLPRLDASAHIVGSLAGEFQGRPEAFAGTDLFWSFQTIFPAQPVGRSQSTFVFTGDSRLGGGVNRTVRIELGAYDVYAGGFSWLTDEDNPRMILGQLDDAGELSLFWPGASTWGVRMSDFVFTRFERLIQEVRFR